MGEEEKDTFKFGLNIQTAEYINNQHKKIEKDSLKLLEIGINIGKILFEVQRDCKKSKKGDFGKWLAENVCFTRMSCYRYIALYNYKEQVADMKNLSAAYKKIDALMAEEKHEADEQAAQRVVEYKKTGIKSKDWRKHTDEKLVKKDKETLDGKCNTVLHFPLNDNQENEKREPLIKKPITEEEEKEELENDPFNDFLDEYLSTFENNSRKIIACQTIMKICRKVIDDLT